METDGKVRRPRNVRSARRLSGFGLAGTFLWLLAAGADAQKIPEVGCRVEDYSIDTLGSCCTDAAAAGQAVRLRGDVHMLGGFTHSMIGNLAKVHGRHGMKSSHHGLPVREVLDKI